MTKNILTCNRTGIMCPLLLFEEDAVDDATVVVAVGVGGGLTRALLLETLLLGLVDSLRRPPPFDNTGLR
jgi:hypothetical protein